MSAAAAPTIIMLVSHDFFFFFNDTATTEIYTLSLHDALPISHDRAGRLVLGPTASRPNAAAPTADPATAARSEEHTSELQSHSDLVCRLLLEKKKKQPNKHKITNNTQQRFPTNPLYEQPKSPC